VNNRIIWGTLVPYGQVWRARANENTTIAFSDPVMIEGKPLEKGTYGLHMIPTENNWSIIFSKNATSWGAFTYDQKEDALRVTVNMTPLPMISTSSSPIRRWSPCAGKRLRYRSSSVWTYRTW